ncbi:hypothetical protein AA13594_2371 [Gluconacetobacter azotocaptans DSM 13594]|nr:hypothetical protein AA13594_2371 [Gluconacetobacter azotocaptans DSM 13594]
MREWLRVEAHVPIAGGNPAGTPDFIRSGLPRTRPEPDRHTPREHKVMSSMSASEIARLQVCLRRLLGSPELTVNPPPRAGLSVEVAVKGEVIGTIHRDEDEGEVSYALHMTILEEDLPAETAAARSRR